jgi:pre-mRNA-splicing factor 38A
MDANLRDVHGMNPQSLIEKIVRGRIYESEYWKGKCHGLTAATVCDRAADLKTIGGTFHNQRPSEFLCLTMKLLQLQPEIEIIEEYIKQEDFKYLKALGCFYLRLVGTPTQIYTLLEPLLLDYRKLRFIQSDGSYRLTYIDEFVDDLLQNERVCDTILPRIPKRFTLEKQGVLEEEEDDDDEEKNEIVDSEDVNIKKVSKLSFKKNIEKESYEENPPKSNSVESLSIDETNKIRISLGLKPLK